MNNLMGKIQKKEGTKLHFKSPTAERRHVLHERQRLRRASESEKKRERKEERTLDKV
jgi:hypothetical protein